MTTLAVSTGAICPADPATALAVIDQVDAALGVELSALHESELPAVDAQLRSRSFRHRQLHVHGPAKGREMAESDLIGELDQFNVDVIMHPDIIEDLPAWTRLGDRLVIENMDARKRFGSAARQLEQIFEVVPDARFCLDVSHALRVGGPQLPLALAQRFSDRLAVVHVGCNSGEQTYFAGPDDRYIDASLDADTIRALDQVAAFARHVPVVLERKVGTDRAALTALLRQLTSVSAVPARL